jgi:hypothetical protein
LLDAIRNDDEHDNNNNNSLTHVPSGVQTQPGAPAAQPLNTQFSASDVTHTHTSR